MADNGNFQFKSLANTDFDTLYKAFSIAFANYDFQVNELQLKSMFKRRGFNSELSFAMFDGDKIASFLCIGIGNYNGIPTAYDTGTGTLPDYRGRGLSSKIFEYAAPVLREKNIKQYLLEVLQHNTNAISAYTKAGFEITRDYNFYVQKKEEVINKIKTPGIQCSIKQIKLEDYESIADFWDFTPSWQNSFESLKRAASDIITLGAFVDGRLAGYCVFAPGTGDIGQIAVDKNFRRKGIASLLLGEVSKMNVKDVLKTVNIVSSSEAITGFLASKNINVSGKLYEMIKKI